MCDNYLITYHKTDILEILGESDESKHFSISINFLELFENDPHLANLLLSEPEESIQEWDRCLLKVQTHIVLQTDTNVQNVIVKYRVHCRIHGLPACPELYRGLFPKNDDAGKFLQVTGTVVRITASKLLEYQRQYICAKCKYQMTVKAEYERKNIIVPPKKCTNPEDCHGTNILNLGQLDSENCKDYQEIKIQEQVSKLNVGSMPNSMWVTLEDDLVEICKPGDNITVCGIVKHRWSSLTTGKKIDIELVLRANHIQITNANSSAGLVTPELKQMFQSYWENYTNRPLMGRDLILKSFCPQLFGLYTVKLAVAVVLAGGVHVQQDSNMGSTGVSVRSEPHLLLVGDPGTGKSHLLRFASKVIPRSVLTTGVGSTAAGLTVTAVMEGGEWQLEGGALVLADGGICCIDEFNSMKEHDRTSIHEAMEQQTISVAKASIVCKLNTRCSVLAASNPKGNLDPSQPLSMNIALASPLLSRFDLILLLRDTVQEDWDTLVADYILDGKHSYSKLTDTVLWNLEMLQVYFAIIKKINPTLSSDAHRILTSYYQVQRRTNYMNKSRTTVRLLDSLIRLSQGHARLMFHQEVKVIDALFAILLIEAAMEQGTSLMEVGLDSHGMFPENPTDHYKKLVGNILTKLNLPDLLEKEIQSIIDSGVNISSTADNVASNKIESRFFVNKKHPVDKSNGIPNYISCKDTDNPTENENSASGTDTVLEDSNIKVGTTANIPREQNRDKGQKVTRKGKALCTSVDKRNDNNNTKILEGCSTLHETSSKKRQKKDNNHKTANKRLKKLLDPVENDLQLLNMIPSVNDGLDLVNFDLDYDSGETSNSEKIARETKSTDKYKNIKNIISKENNSKSMIPSVSDGLDLVNFDLDYDNGETINSENIARDTKSTDKYKNIKNIISKENNSKSINKKVEEKNDSGLVENSNIEEDYNISDIMKLTQNSKLKMLREKFKFKPKKTMLPKQNSVDSGLGRSISEQSRTSSSNSIQIFQSQPEEIDDLNLDI